MDLNLLPLLLAVAEERNFLRRPPTGLASRGPLVSQGIRRARGYGRGTAGDGGPTRAVRLTEAGERLVRKACVAPMGGGSGCVSEVNSDAPSGRLRLAVTSLRRGLPVRPIAGPGFAEAHPKIIVR